MSRAKIFLKRIVNGVLGAVGLRISRIEGAKPLSAKYFNTGALTPQEENAVGLYDAFYSDVAAVEDYYSKDRMAFYRGVLDFVGDSDLSLDGKEIADVGCGVGYLIKEIQGRYRPASLAGFDFSPAAIEYSRSRFPGARFAVHDIYDPVPGTFDVLFCTEVLEHLEYPHRALEQLVRAVGRSGALVLTVPNGRLDDLNEHINFWSPESWSAFLARECPTCRVTTATLFDGKVNVAILQAPE